MPSAETRKILEDLKSDGFDISSIENQIAVNPILEKRADMRLGGGLLRQEEYTRMANAINRSKANPNDLQVKVNKLASLHDFAGTLEANDPLYQSTLERIVTAEDELISMGHDPTEVKAVSVDAGKGITIKKDEVIEKKVEDKVVAINNGVTTEEFQKGLATIGLGSVAVSTKANRLIREAEALGIIVTPELEEKLLEGIQTRFAAGTATLDQVANDVLGLDKKKAEVKLAADAEAIRKAREEGKAEGRTETEKEYGGAPRRQVGRKESPVYARADRIRENVVMPANGNGIKKTDDGKIEAPTNAKGEVEYWRLRGNKNARIENASSLINDEEAMSKLGAVAD